MTRATLTMMRKTQATLVRGQSILSFAGVYRISSTLLFFASKNKFPLNQALRFAMTAPEHDTLPVSRIAVTSVDRIE